MMFYEALRKGLKIQYDEETKQYYAYNDETRGVYGLWKTKEDAFEEYIKTLRESILVDAIEYKKHEAIFA